MALYSFEIKARCAFCVRFRSVAEGRLIIKPSFSVKSALMVRAVSFDVQLIKVYRTQMHKGFFGHNLTNPFALLSTTILFHVTNYLGTSVSGFFYPKK